MVGPFDEEALVHPWRHPDPRVDGLQATLARMVEEATARGESRHQIFARAWTLAGLPEDEAPGELVGAGRAGSRAPVPYLTEPWYC